MDHQHHRKEDEAHAGAVILGWLLLALLICAAYLRSAS